MGDEDKAVLAGRVLSYLKRKFGHGSQPSADETKAAIAAAMTAAKEKKEGSMHYGHAAIVCGYGLPRNASTQAAM